MDFTSEVASHASSHFTSGLAAFGVDPMPLTAPTTLPAAKALVRWRYTSQLFGCLKWEVATMIKGARAESHPNFPNKPGRADRTERTRPLSKLCTNEAR